MFLQSSRYKNSKKFAFNKFFQGIRMRSIKRTEGVVEYIIKDGDRLDFIAYHYYNDPRLWWRILDANPTITFSSNLLLQDVVGKKILIPMERDE